MSAPALTNWLAGLSAFTADWANGLQQTCDTLAQVRSFTGGAGSQLYVRSTDGSVAGGPGVFYWNVTSTATDDSGLTTIAPSGQTLGGRWLRSNLLISPVLNASFPTAPVGSLIVNSGGSPVVWSTLAPGFAGSVLTSNGPGLQPSYVAPGGIIYTAFTPTITAGTGTFTT